MDVRPIKTERDYEMALERIDELMDATYGSDEGDELDVLVTLVEAYETDKYEIPDADPVEAIKFVMDQRGLKAKDLVPIFGTSGRASEVLNYQRSLSIQMIRRIRSSYDIPAEVLIKDYRLKEKEVKGHMAKSVAGSKVFGKVAKKKAKTK